MFLKEKRQKKEKVCYISLIINTLEKRNQEHEKMKMPLAMVLSFVLGDS